MNDQKKPFVFRKHVAFHETDTMGVVHHSNYVRYFEEARVAWMRDRQLIGIHTPLGPYSFAVIDVEARYLRPVQFDDEIEVFMEVKMEGARMRFQYAIWCARLATWSAVGKTTLVPLDTKLRPAKLPQEVRAVFQREPWSDTWPPEMPARSCAD